MPYFEGAYEPYEGVEMIFREKCIYCCKAKLGIECLLGYKSCKHIEGVTERKRFWDNGDCRYFSKGKLKKEGADEDVKK